MSFGTNSLTKNATGQLQNIGTQAGTNSAKQIDTGQDLFSTGGQNTASGTNYFNSLLHGNQADTTNMLSPDINRIRNTNQGAAQSASTLMPRGGGRSGTLFQLPFQNQAQIGGLFSGARSGAAGSLASIGQNQQSMGTALQGIGNNALNTSANADSSLADIGLRQQQMVNSLWSGLGSGVFGLASMGMGGGGGGFANLFRGGGQPGFGNGSDIYRPPLQLPFLPGGMPPATAPYVGPAPGR